MAAAPVKVAGATLVALEVFETALADPEVGLTETGVVEVWTWI